jgi:hypothetical protein
LNIGISSDPRAEFRSPAWVTVAGSDPLLRHLGGEILVDVGQHVGLLGEFGAVEADLPAPRLCAPAWHGIDEGGEFAIEGSLNGGLISRFCGHATLLLEE